jgi:DNA mismatch repair protein MutS
VPVHTKDHYIAKLIKGGFRVALCDQLEPATPGVVVKRGVTQVFTPATLTDAHMLDEKKPSILLSCFPEETGFGLLFSELLTSQIQATTATKDQERLLYDEVARFFPDEIIMPNTAVGKNYATRLKAQGYAPLLLETPDLSPEQLHNWLAAQFSSDVVRSVTQNRYLSGAVSYFYAYLSRTHRAALDQFYQFQIYTPDQFLVLDAATQRNLELVRNVHDGSIMHTVYETIDRTHTPMGSRLLRRWLLAPLVNADAITARHAFVAYCVEQYMEADHIHLLSKAIGDLERIVGRIALGKAQLHDYIALKKAVSLIPAIKQWLTTVPTVVAQYSAQQIGDFDQLFALLERAFADEMVGDRTIKAGFDAQLDTYRATIDTITQQLQDFEQREQRETGIGSLKVGYNNVHGYYLEITNTHREKVPARYMRKQTLAGKERYITPELQILESNIQRAQALIAEHEKQIYAQVKAAVADYVPLLRRAAYTIATIDVLLSYAAIARDNRYVLPTMLSTSRDVLIKVGRHPVVEAAQSERFIANDCALTDEASTWIITGPNMGGKSTFLRQNAIIQIMAQAGSFVPAKMAQLPLVDRIFTRIGAGDNVVQGKSTFLVEMEETATICTNATERSLVILDEVGRGTSTYDGLALAQAVVEYIHTTIRARCLFATHYHELVELEKSLPGLVSYHATSRRTPSGIVFLYKMSKGAADGSFGIEVARLAKLPPEIIARARTLLTQLGVHHAMPNRQLSIHEPPHAELEKYNTLAHALTKINPDDLSPRSAHDLLCELKKMMEK